LSYHRCPEVLIFLAALPKDFQLIVLVALHVVILTPQEHIYQVFKPKALSCIGGGFQYHCNIVLAFVLLWWVLTHIARHVFATHALIVFLAKVVQELLAPANG